MSGKSRRKHPHIMKRIVISVSLFLIFFSAFAGAADEDAEEQGSAYEENADQPAPLPEYRAPARPSYSPRGVLSRSIDVTVLFLGLLAASFIFVRKKAPGYARLLLFFSMLYFGFFRHGCVCAPGALGNIGIHPPPFRTSQRKSFLRNAVSAGSRSGMRFRPATASPSLH